MSKAAEAEQHIRQSDPTAALKALQNVIRANPADPELRIFLFQILCVLRDWDRALNQLQVIEQLSPAAGPMVQTCRPAILCERLRDEVFAGRKTPLLFGEPEGWLALLIEALLREGQGDGEAARALRATALDQAPGSSGILDGQAFEWIADGDSRLGPVLEAIVNGKYYWVPFSRLARIAIEAPTDLRDSVWAPAELEFVNGGLAPALIPTRYTGRPEAGEGALMLARGTRWTEAGPDVWHGIGQRMLVTDQGEYALLDLREIVLHAATDATGNG